MESPAAAGTAAGAALDRVTSPGRSSGGRWSSAFSWSDALVARAAGCETAWADREVGSGVETVGDPTGAKPIRLFVDPKSFLYLAGMVLDFEETLMRQGFNFINPNSTKSCGCGSSFSA